MKPLLVAALALMPAAALAEPAHWTQLREMPFPENYPTADSVEVLYDEMQFHRATQVVMWSLPAMTLWAMKKGSEAEFGEGLNGCCQTVSNQSQYSPNCRNLC